MKKLFVPVLLLTLLVLTAAPALAGLTWCSTDPLVRLPDGGVFHVLAAVPQGYEADAFTLTLAVPTGSRLAGQSHRLNMVVVLQDGPEGEVTAAAQAGFPVKVAARYRGAEFAEYILESPENQAVWSW